MHAAFLALTLLLTVACAYPQSETRVSKPVRSGGFLKNLTVESFGVGRAAVSPGYEFEPSITSTHFNLRGLVCPLCVPGPPPDRTRAILPAFGARAGLPLWNGRVTLFAGYGGTDAITYFGSSRLTPASMRATPFNDGWLAQTDIGVRVALDPGKYLSLGAAHSYLNDFGPAKAYWTKTAFDISFSPAVFREMAHGIRKILRRRPAMRLAGE